MEVISTASALTGTSMAELIRPGLHRAFPLPSEGGPNEARFRRLLDMLAQSRSGSAAQRAQ